MATHSSTLAWKIPWTEEPGGLQSMRSQRVGHDPPVPGILQARTLEWVAISFSSIHHWVAPKHSGDPGGYGSQEGYLAQHSYFIKLVIASTCI